MTTSRQKVLNHLKKTRSASAREIARALKMSAPNVRHHLSILCADGRVEMTESRPGDGRGRPEKLFSLAQSALGDNLSVLADALLDERFDPERIGSHIAISQGLKGIESQPMTKRLAVLVEKLNGMHYQARWEAGAEGPRILFGRCPYSKVIENHPELCTMDEALLKTAMTRVVHPVRRSGLKPGMCPFLFEIG